MPTRFAGSSDSASLLPAQSRGATPKYAYPLRKSCKRVGVYPDGFPRLPCNARSSAERRGNRAAKRMSRPPGENLAHRSGVRCDRRSGVVRVHEQREYERTTTQTTTATAQEEFVVEPVAEKTVTELPAGPLYWHVENFPALADAEAAAGPLSLATDVEGKVWLFTLGPKPGSVERSAG